MSKSKNKSMSKEVGEPELKEAEPVNVVKKREFIDAVIANAFSKAPVSNAVLAKQLGITERDFYYRKRRYAEALNAACGKLVASLRLVNLGALSRKLMRANPDDSTIALAANLTGDLGKKILEGSGLPVDREEKAATVINVGLMNEKELEGFIDRRLQETRAVNKRKSQKKN